MFISVRTQFFSLQLIDGCYPVKYRIFIDVRRQQDIRLSLHLPIPGSPLSNTSECLSLVNVEFHAVLPWLRWLTFVFKNNLTSHLYPTIPACIKKTWAEEGVRGFYRGLGTNLVRVLPGTCVTFVVYENLAWLLRSTAARRERRKQIAAGEGP